MRIIRPATIDSNALVSSNAVETAPVYNPATTYAAGQMVRRSATFDFTGGVMPAGASVTSGSGKFYTNSSGTMAAAGSNVGRLDYDPITHASLGILLETAATNVFQQSQTLSASPNGSAAGSTITADATTAPDGTTTAELQKSFAGTGNQFWYQLPSLTATTWVQSYFVKAKEYSKFLIIAQANGTYPYAVFDTATGTYSIFGAAAGGAGMVYLGNGWWRIWLYYAVTPSGANQTGMGPTPNTSYAYTGDGTSGGYLWGGQVELGTVPSSYIPTTSASVTRAADTLTLDAGSRGVPDGTYTVRYTYSDGSTQDVSTTITGGTFSRSNINARLLTASVLGFDSLERLYESAQSGNTGHALTDPAWWIDAGPSNRWAMFDTVNGTSTSGPTGLDVQVQPLGRVDSVALLNLSAATARVKATDSVAGLIYDQTFSLVADAGVQDWYAYFYEPIVRSDTLVISDIPLFSGPLVEVILSAGGGPVSVGTMIAGQSKTLGSTALGASVGIMDYSRKEADDFGNYVLIERAFSRKGSFSVMLDAGDVDEVDRLLQGYRATPIVWIGADAYSATVIFGFYRDFNIEISYPTVSFCSLEIEGLT